MKKLKLFHSSVDTYNEILTRDQLKNVLGGTVTTESGACYSCLVDSRLVNGRGKCYTAETSACEGTCTQYDCV